MEFTDAYFEDEVRDGFYVSSMMKKAWAAQLEVLYEVQKVCKKHNIRYFAEWGTLLGAVRHGGVIPWDDDLDICMLSKEYNRFLEVKDELPQGYSISEYHTNKSDNMVVRVNNSNHIVVAGEQLEQFHGFPYTAGIDIFRLDYLPRSEEDMKTHHDMVLIIGAIIGLTMKVDAADESDENYDEVVQEREKYLCQLEKMCHKKFVRDDALKKNLYHFLIEEVADIYGPGASDEVTNLPRWSENINYRLPKRCYEDVIEMPFENFDLAVPVGYAQLLGKKYGPNFMNPVRAGSAHEYPYYDFFGNYLEENTMAEIYQYIFDDEEWKNTKKQRQAQKEKMGLTLQEYLRQFVPLFQEIHTNIIDFIVSNRGVDACSLIGDCQDTAIEIGNQIEEQCSGDVEIIPVLEGYCEILFHIYNQLSGNVESQTYTSEDIRQEFANFEVEFAKKIDELPRRKEIVFIPYKASYWDTMYPVWKKAMQEENTDVYVIPAPYYYKDAWGRVKKQEEQYDLTGYPEEVVLTSYQEYSFENRHPDEIIIQCPYDEYNYAMTIHPAFYAKNLYQYTEKLVYIPALMMDEVEETDSRAKKMLKAYCNTPGVVCADKVIVQSEQMKQVYIELLTEFGGEETKDIWEEKIVDGDYADLVPWNKKSREELEIPDEWRNVIQKPDGSWKKIVLYTTSASALYCYSDAMLEKMEQVLEQFKTQQDEVVFWWYPDGNVRNVLRKSNPGVWRRYSDLIQRYQEEAWGIWDDTGDLNRVVEMCDEVIGDAGVLLNRCRNTKKEVTLQVCD